MNREIIMLLASVAFLGACMAATNPESGEEFAPVPVAAPGQSVAVVAGGCFWCMESDFDKLEGVVATTSGYAGGSVDNPTYMEVAGQGTGHLEALHVVYDTSKLSYEQLLTYFFHHVDPTDAGGQFCDRGPEYVTGIFPQDAEQAKVAETVKASVGARLRTEIVTRVFEPGVRFWPAEAYHQDFHDTNPVRYTSYRMGCRRDEKVKALWGATP